MQTALRPPFIEPRTFVIFILRLGSIRVKYEPKVLGVVSENWSEFVPIDVERRVDSNGPSAKPKRSSRLFVSPIRYACSKQLGNRRFPC